MEWVRAAGSFAAALVALLLGLGLRDYVYKPKLVLTSRDDDSSTRIVMPLADGSVGGGAVYASPTKEGQPHATSERAFSRSNAT